MEGKKRLSSWNVLGIALILMGPFLMYTTFLSSETDFLESDTQGYKSIPSILQAIGYANSILRVDIYLWIAGLVILIASAIPNKVENLVEKLKYGHEPNEMRT